MAYLGTKEFHQWLEDVSLATRFPVHLAIVSNSRLVAKHEGGNVETC